jgi:hypothetical protein
MGGSQICEHNLRGAEIDIKEIGIQDSNLPSEAVSYRVQPCNQALEGTYLNTNRLCTEFAGGDHENAAMSGAKVVQ